MSELLLKIKLTPGQIHRLLELGSEKYNLHDLNEIVSCVLDDYDEQLQEEEV